MSKNEQETPSRDVLRKFAVCRTLKDLYEEIVEIALKESNAEKSVLFIEEYDEEKGKILRPVTNRNFETGLYTKDSKSLTTYIWNRESIDDMVEIRNQKELTQFFKKTYKLDKDRGDYYDLTYEEGDGDFHSLIGTPLIFRGKCYGVLKVENKLDENKKPQKGGFTERDKNMFQVIALSAALHISSLMEKEYIIDILNVVSRTKTLDELYKTVVTLARKYSDAESSSLFIVDADRKKLVCKIATGSHIRLVGQEYLLSPPPHSVTEHIFKIRYDEKEFKNNLVHISYGYSGDPRRKEMFFTNEAGYTVYNGLSNFYKEVYDTDKKRGDFDDLTYPEENEFYNLIGTPLIVGGKCYGVLKVENKKGSEGGYDEFSEYDMEIFMSIAICAALHISSYYEQHSNITRISSIVIHDMYNKLAPIRGIIEQSSQLLVGHDRLGDEVGEKLYDVLDKIDTLRKNLNRIGEVYNIRYYPLTIPALRENISNLIKEKKKEREYQEIKVKLDLNYEELQKVEHYFIRRIHHTVIASIIENTLTNSARHFWRKEGKDEYRIKLFPIFTKGLTKLCIEISDNGEGIDRRYEDDYNQIFEPLSTGDSRTGVGLGLWLVKQYIDEMGGTIHVKSVHRDMNESTSGTTINIQLPITDVIEKKKIIILEDTLDTRAVMIDLLKPYYNVTAVESEEEFHEIFKPEEFGAVMCDYYLRGDTVPTGANIIKEISEEGFKKTKILYSQYTISADNRSKVDKIAAIIEKTTSNKQILYTLLEEFYEREF